MKYLILILLTLSLLLTVGCTNTPETPDTTLFESTPAQPDEGPEAMPMPEVDPEDQMPTGTDSDLPAPEIGPEGLPTPAL